MVPTLVNPAIDPTLGITPSVPFAYGDRPQNQWRLLPAPPRPAKGENEPNWQDSELVLFDLGGGLNTVWGRLFPHYLGVDLGDSNRTSSANGIDVSYPEQAVLSTFMNTEAIWGGGDSHQYSSLYIYDDLFFGSGSTANKCLYRESTAAPGLAAVTYNPGANIMSLTALQFDGAAPKMTIGLKDTNAVTLASDLSTTVTLNSGATLWGGCVSPLGATSSTNILYQSDTNGSNTASLATIPTTSAATVAGTPTGTALNAGGYVVGIANVAVTPGNLVPRILLVIPRIPAPNGMFSTSALPPKADIIHVNLYGTDPQYLLTNLPWVTFCTINAGVPYYSDGFTWMRNDGTETDLGWVYEREQDSDYKYFSAGGGFARGQLVVAVCRLNLTTVASSQMWFEKLDVSDKAKPRWFQCSKVLAPGVTATFTDLGPGYIDRQVLLFPNGSLGYSLKSASMYMIPLASNGLEKDYYQFIGPAGYSHFWNYRFTAGSTKAGQKTEASGTWDSPALSLPWPLKGLPTTIIGVGLYGDVLAGGTGSTVGSTSAASIMFQQATQGATGAYSYTNNINHIVHAHDGLQYQDRWRDFAPTQGDPFNRLKFRLTATQDATRTDWSPNLLPIVIRMRTFTDGVVH